MFLLYINIIYTIFNNDILIIDYLIYRLNIQNGCLVSSLEPQTGLRKFLDLPRIFLGTEHLATSSVHQ